MGFLNVAALASQPSQINNDKGVKVESQIPALEIIDIDDPSKNKILTTLMQPVKFPLSQENLDFINALKSKVVELEAAGLAATQVGVAKPITVFHVDKEALKWREDVTELVPLTVLINPSYEGIESFGKNLDWEGCFSGKKHYGKIWRYKAIIYKGQDMQGNPVEGRAYGFLARLLQHEIDHCRGQMCIHNYDPNFPQGAQAELMPHREEETKKRKQALGITGEYFNFMPIPTQD